MKRLLQAFLAAMLIAGPSSVRADQTGPLAPPLENPAAFQIMEQAHAKMEQLHSQARLSMLNSISPAQRTLLAQAVGQMAIAPNPDVAAAAKQLDASLTPAQAKAILGISASLEQQARQVMDSAHQQMMRVMPAGAPGHGPWDMQRMVMHKADDQWLSDPGMILLTTAMRSTELGEFHHVSGALPGP
jgi:hypothetical protein